MESISSGSNRSTCTCILKLQARIQRGAGGPDPLKNHENAGFLSNTGPDPLINHKATKLAFNVGPSSARQRKAMGVSLAGR